MRMITVVYRKSQPCLNNMLSKFNLATSEQPQFILLLRHDGATQEEMSSLLFVDKAATARAVKSLEEKGFVKRIQDKHDRRQNKVFLTDKGKEYGPMVKQELLNFNKLLTQGIDSKSLDIMYDALVALEENAVNLSKAKNAEQDGVNDGNAN